MVQVMSMSTGLKGHLEPMHLLWFSLYECQVPTKAALSHPFLSWTGEKKYDERLEGRDRDRERSLTDYCHRQNRPNLGEKKKV